MKTVLIIGGITEAAVLAKRLAAGYRVLLSTATEYGAQLAEAPSYTTIWGKRDAAGFVRLLEEYRVSLTADCSHPFAEGVSAEIAEACQRTGTPLVRYRREESAGNGGIVRRVRDFVEAAGAAEELRAGKMVFSTVGSNHLPEIAAVVPPECIAARVLDRPESAEACARAGIPPAQVLMARGPFTLEENLRDFGGFPTGVVLTKDSGAAGGTAEKLEAARRLGIPVVMVTPPAAHGEVYTSLDALCRAVGRKLGEPGQDDADNFVMEKGRCGMETLKPMEIEKRSFEIITEELGGLKLDPEKEPIIKRVIHTTADFDYVRTLCFSDGVVARAVEALKNGADVVTDTKMAAAGINKTVLARFGGSVHCFISDEDVAAAAKAEGITRAAVSMRKAAQELHKPVIFAIGNAPTALIELDRLMREGKVAPALVVGVPVGFVHVCESKELIMQGSAPYIVARGRKGGSNVAASILNALLYMTSPER